jgi:drug/metabolite transporter (DMT)-like permease
VRERALPVTAVAVMFGTLPMVPLVRADAIDALLGAPLSLGAWAFLAFGATVLAFWLWNVPLKTISPTTLAVFVHFIPLVAISFSILAWRTERFNPWLLVGGAVVIAGVVLANEAQWAPRRASPVTPLAPEGSGASPSRP